MVGTRSPAGRRRHRLASHPAVHRARRPGARDRQPHRLEHLQPRGRTRTDSDGRAERHASSPRGAGSSLVLLVVVALALVPVFVSGARISRVEGALFVATYIGYLAWLLLNRT